MARKATGQLYEHVGPKGKSWGVRFRYRGGRHHVTLGRSWEGCTEERALAEREFLIERVNRGMWEPDPPRDAGPEPVPDFLRFASRWFEDRRVEGGRSGRGLGDGGNADLRWRLETHLLPYFAAHRLDQIDVRAVDDYRRFKVREGRLSASSINKTISTLAAILEVALEYEHVRRNPAKGRRRRLPEPRPRRTYVDCAEHLAALLAAAGELDAERRARPHRRAFLATLMFAGPRLGEALALRWSDVDLPGGRLRLRGTKTHNASRDVDLLPVLRDELGAHAAADQDRRPDDLVFRTSADNGLGGSNVRRRLLAPAVERADERLEELGAERIPEGLTPHSLRRTFASILVALGENPADVMVQLGHADPGFTLAVYARAMRRGDGERERLRALVEGRGNYEVGASSSEGAISSSV